MTNYMSPYSYSNLYALHYKHQIMYRVTFEINIVFWPIRIKKFRQKSSFLVLIVCETSEKRHN